MSFDVNGLILEIIAYKSSRRIGAKNYTASICYEIITRIKIV